MSQTFNKKLMKINQLHGLLPGFIDEYFRLLNLLKLDNPIKQNKQNEDNGQNENNENNEDNKEGKKQVNQNLKLWIETAFQVTGKKVVRKDDPNYDKVKELYLQKKIQAVK
jgi:hypothetical protein